MSNILIAQEARKKIVAEKKSQIKANRYKARNREEKGIEQ